MRDNNLNRYILALAAVVLSCGTAVAAPVADFTVFPGLRVPAGDYMSVDALLSQADAGRSLVSYEWQWNNYNIYSGQDASTFAFTANASGALQDYMFPYVGSFRVTLRVTDDQSAMAIAQRTILVECAKAPIAVQSGPYTISIGEGLRLDGSASTDPDLPFGDQIVKYEWLLNGYYQLAQGYLVDVSWSRIETALQQMGYTNLENTWHQLGLRVTDTTGRYDINTTYLSIVPEPGTITLLAAGLCGLVVRRRKPLLM